MIEERVALDEYDAMPGAGGAAGTQARPNSPNGDSPPERTTLSGITHLVTDHLLGAGKREVISIDERSRAPVPWWTRCDPYWDTTLYDARHEWSSVRPTPHSKPIQSSPYIYEYDDTKFAPAGQPTSMSDVLQRIGEADAETLDLWRRALSLVFLTGAISDEQCAALLHPTTADGTKLPSLWDIAELGAIEGAWHHPPGMPYPRSLIWRVADGEAYDAITSELIVEGVIHEYFAGAHPALRMPGSSHIRHQQLANELALRALEASEDWAVWMPEAVCTPDVFVPPDHPARFREHSMRADGCLVRLDGGRVFIEIQASHNTAKVAEKVMRWSRLYDEGAFGAVVLFVAATPSAGIGAAVAGIKDAIRSHASHAAAGSLLVGQWTDYSPDSHQVSADGLSLRAAHLTPDGEWVDTSAMDVEVTGGDWYLLAQVPGLRCAPLWATDGIPRAA